MILENNKMYVEDNDIVELMLANKQARILPKDLESYQEFELFCKKYNLTVPFDLDSDSDDITWHMPKYYQNLDIRDFLLDKHRLNDKQIARLDMELREFHQRNLDDVLKFLIFFVKTLRDNNIVYGVGRGSSIASYVLYLIGVHRIDSLRYDLDIKEFLK